MKSQFICLECGNQIMEGQKRCPCCQVPLQIDGLACPKCSSTMLHTEKIGLSDDIAAIAAWVVCGGMNISTKAKDLQDCTIICLKCNYKFMVDQTKNMRSM